MSTFLYLGLWAVNLRSNPTAELDQGHIVGSEVVASVIHGMFGIICRSISGGDCYTAEQGPNQLLTAHHTRILFLLL